MQAGAQKTVTEASLYCRTVVRDVITRRRLMHQYPNRIYPLMYDDVVRDLAGHTRNVYRFIDERIPAKTYKWIANNAHRKRNGTTIANRWRDNITVHQNELILSVCSELFRLLQLAPDIQWNCLASLWRRLLADLLAAVIKFEHLVVTILLRTSTLYQISICDCELYMYNKAIHRT